MDFSIDPTVQELVGRIREFVDRKLLPLEPRLLESGIAGLLPEVKALMRERFRSPRPGPA